MASRVAFRVAGIVGVIAACNGGGGGATAPEAPSNVAEAGTTPPGSTPDAASARDATPASDAPSDVDSAVVPTYGELDDANRWSTFDVHRDGGAFEYQGSTFDGRYLYFAPSNSGRVLRYDTRGAFDDHAAWAVMDLVTLPGGHGAYVGAVFDGRHVYFIPFASGTVARLDATGAFTSPSSWTLIDLTTFDAGARGYVGGAFDGRYLYLSPFRRQDFIVHGLAARYDTQAALESREAWTFHDLATTVHPELKGLTGIAYDGTYLYYTPYNETLGHRVARYDPRLPFAQAGSWATFDVGALDPECRSFQGAVFDGRFLYYVPGRLGAGSILARFDTRAPFGEPASWSKFDLARVSPAAAGFIGGHFDGRFIYFSPYGARNSGVVFRHDTLGALDDLATWSTFDLTSKNPSAKAFSGWGFDGRFLYLAADGFGTFARFDARSPPGLSPFTPTFL